MATVPHTLRGWWRYSRLTFVPLIITAIVALCLTALAFTEHHAFESVIAALLAVCFLGQLAWGAVNAERARRYGCW